MMLSSFLFGALGYPLLELSYRRRTHYSMGIAGGLSMLLIRLVSNTRCRFSVKALMCGAGITGIEYLCGIIWNRRYTVWDYRNEPMNYRGQICLRFTAIWCLLSSAALLLLALIDTNKKPD